MAFFIFFFTCEPQEKIRSLRSERMEHQEINLLAHRHPQSFHPHECYDQSCKSYLNLISDRLYLIQSDTKATYLVGARSHEVLGTHHVFCLNPKSNWSDGSPLKVEDWLRTFFELAKNQSVNRDLLVSLQLKNAEEVLSGKQPLSALGVKKINKDCFYLDSPLDRPLISRILAHTTFSPLHQNQKNWRNEDILKRPEDYLVSGPFRLKSAPLPSLKVPTLVKRANYSASPTGKIQVIHTLFDVQNPENFFFSYQTGLIDLLYVGSQSIEEKVLKKHLPLKKIMGCNLYFLELNHRSPLIQDLFFRQQLVTTLKREELIYKVLEKVASITTKRFITSSLLPSQETLKMTSFAPLKEGVIQTSHALTLLTTENPTNHYLGLYLQNLWEKNLGIKVDLVKTTDQMRLKKLERGEFDLALSQLVPDYQVESNLLEKFQTHHFLNHGGYSNPDFDHLLKQANLKPEKRLFYSLKAERILQEEVAAIPLFESGYYVSYPKELKSLFHSSIEISTDFRQAFWDSSAKKSP